MKSIVIETENIAKAISDYATTFHLPIDKIDFDIIQINYFTKGYLSEDWSNISYEELVKIDEEIYRTEKFEIKESYVLKIFYFKDKRKEFNYKLAANKDLTELFIYFTESPKDTEKFRLNFYEYLNKNLLLNGILNFFIDKDKIQSFIENIIKFGEPLKCNVSSGFPLIKSINDAIILNYKKNQDPHNRQFIDTIKENEIIAEYIKAKPGKNGRNCKGKIVKVSEPIEKYKNKLTNSQDVLKTEDEKKIYFIAKKQGYVSIKSGVISINNELTLKEVSFKKTGNIEDINNADIILNINSQKDANAMIHSVVRVKDFISKGFIDTGTKVYAEKVDISGGIHKKSYIEGIDVKINFVRGTVKAEKAIIENCEGGEIIADYVEINKAVGSNIKAKKVYIKNLYSNCTINATDEIIIDNIIGEENILIINPLALESKGALVMKLQKLDKAKKDIEQVTIKIVKLKSVLEKTKNYFFDIRNKIKEYNQWKKPVPRSWEAVVENYNKQIYEMKMLKMSIEDKKILLDTLISELNFDQSKVLQGKIKCTTGWSGYNKLCFKSVVPDKEFSIVPDGKEKYKTYYLKQIGEDKFEISKDF